MPVDKLDHASPVPPPPQPGVLSLTSARRHRQDAPTNSTAINRWLLALAGQIGKRPRVHGVIVVVLDDGPPRVAINGVEKAADLAEAARALSDAVDWCSSYTRTYAVKGMEPAERTMAGWVAWRWWGRLYEQARAEDAKRSERRHRPWTCEHCERRYTSQRRAETHEAICLKNPHSKRFGPDGDLLASKNEDGRVVGWQRRPPAS